MKVKAGMIVYKRKKTVDLWMNAWRQSEHYGDATLTVVHNCDGTPNQREQDNIMKWAPDKYVARPNEGQDIGAFRDTIRTSMDEPWDVLFWAVDDNIPMRKDFLRAFVEPFEQNPNMGLVGNYWVKDTFYKNWKGGVPSHFRTSCFAISRAAAMRLCFPIRLEDKWDSYKFEWLDKQMNMTEQVKRMGFDMMPVTGDWDTPWVDTNTYVWDVGCLHMKNSDPRCRKDHWARYNTAFTPVEPDL